MEPASLYKACDIRGRDDGELSAALYERWGRVLGCRVEAGAAFVAGGDVRESTPAYLEALCAGAAAAGARVVSVGIAPTPMVYFGRRHLQAPACAIVTASHSPPGINGLKWMVGPRPPDEAEVQSLRAGEGPTRWGGSRSEVDLSAAYGEWLRHAWAGRRCRLQVVVDRGTGGWSGRAAAYLQAAFPGLEVTAIHDRADGRFPERNPDSARPEHLRDLSAAVRARGADLGIAFDGDGDRVAFADGTGTVLSAEEATQLLLRAVGRELKDRAFVYDLKFSDRVAEAARTLGAEPRAQRSGHAFIRRTMMDAGARFGAEISGHYFDADLDGGDDGLYTACRLLAWLGESGERLEDLRRGLPAVHLTPDLRVKAEAAAQAAVLEQVRRAFADRPQSRMDGVRVDFEEGWALVRPSVTEAALTFRFEGRDRAGLAAVVERFCSALPEVGPQVADAFRRQGEKDP
ncbi:MAG: hypothetical protein ABIL09_20745 [Gemmatimonadota bacterium]